MAGDIQDRSLAYRDASGGYGRARVISPWISDDRQQI